MLAPRVGEEFPAMVTGAGRGRATVQLREPAVLASVDDASLAPGTEVRLRLDVADLVARTVTFSLAGA